MQRNLPLCLKKHCIRQFHETSLNIIEGAFVVNVVPIKMMKLLPRHHIDHHLFDKFPLFYQIDMAACVAFALPPCDEISLLFQRATPVSCASIQRSSLFLANAPTSNSKLLTQYEWRRSGVGCCWDRCREGRESRKVRFRHVPKR